MPDEGWIDNSSGRAPRNKDEKRFLRFANGHVTPAPVRVGGFRWTRNDPQFGGRKGSAFDIIASRRAE